jgi:N-acetylglutamate synthase
VSRTLEASEPPEGPGAEREVATWPPQTVIDVDGWRAGLSGGVTRRANSVLPVGEPADVEAALRAVEALYADAGQPAVFRIDPAAQPGLDALLEARGYRAAAATDVLVRSLAGVPAAGPVAVDVADEPDPAWLGLWSGTKAPLGSASGGVDAGFVRGVLTAAPAIYLTARDDDGPLGVVRAAFVDDWVGLSCLVVDPRARRRGLGRALTLRALHEAVDRGASCAFLQVEVENTAAATLYAGLGFQSSGRYHYRQRG